MQNIHNIPLLQSDGQAGKQNPSKTGFSGIFCYKTETHMKTKQVLPIKIDDWQKQQNLPSHSSAITGNFSLIN